MMCQQQSSMNESDGAPAPEVPTLSPDDHRHLAAFEKKLQMVRDRTAAVARGYSTGFFLHGSGGMSKSFTVLKTLRELKADYKLFNSRMTGRGLYNALERFPDSTHVLHAM